MRAASRLPPNFTRRTSARASVAEIVRAGWERWLRVVSYVIPDEDDGAEDADPDWEDENDQLEKGDAEEQYGGE
jgi:hypothetical protein